MKSKYVLIFFFLGLFAAKSQNNEIENKLLELIKPFKGKVGVSALNLKTNERIEINGNEKFPMQSVYKFPLAIAVFDQIDKRKLSLTQKINLKKSDLLPDTHSPLRELYPNGKENIELKEILEKTVSESDNNGCDYLFKLLGGCNNVNDFIHRFTKTGIEIVGTEAEMHKDAKVQYANYSTPSAMTSLLGKFYQQKTLTKASTQALWQMLTATITAPNRIKGQLPKNTIVGHKSGWSGSDEKGFTAAINDAGIIILPNGSALALTIFVSETYEKDKITDQLASSISKLLFEHFSKK